MYAIARSPPYKRQRVVLGVRHGCRTIRDGTWDVELRTVTLSSYEVDIRPPRFSLGQIEFAVVRGTLAVSAFDPAQSSSQVRQEHVSARRGEEGERKGEEASWRGGNGNVADGVVGELRKRGNAMIGERGGIIERGGGGEEGEGGLRRGGGGERRGLAAGVSLAFTTGRQRAVYRMSFTWESLIREELTAR